MYGHECGGMYPDPHSGKMSMPEFLQELYAKINECVSAVNECIRMTETFGNVSEMWAKVKAECDMTMERYANIMAGYDKSVTEYTGVLEELEGRISELSQSVQGFDSMMQRYEQEVNTAADNALAELAVLEDSIISIGSTDGWTWRKYKSGRVEATKCVVIDPNGKVSYSGNGQYSITYDVTFPFALNSDVTLFLQAVSDIRTVATVEGCANNYGIIWLHRLNTSFPFDTPIEVYCRLEGFVDG